MKKAKKVLLAVGTALFCLVLLWLFLQFVFPHRNRPFLPDYPKEDLAPLLAQEALTDEDYATLLFQTGLSKTAVDDLLARGEAGRQQILATQSAFFAPPGMDVCGELGITTREHRYRDEAGALVCAVPLAPLREGDIILSFSTHTAGWMHGHAGLVLDPDSACPVTLESVVLGSPSGMMNGNHWRCYTTMMIVRPKANDAQRTQAVEIARQHLVDIPYSLVSGVFGEKLQPLEGPHSAQCGYLPWYAWAAAGVDLDGDGGRVVAPLDLGTSENVQVIQVFGLDPARFF